MNFFDRKDLGNHLLQLYPKVVKHLVYVEKCSYIYFYHRLYMEITACIYDEKSPSKDLLYSLYIVYTAYIYIYDKIW
jgi:hypothetical protein